MRKGGEGRMKRYATGNINAASKNLLPQGLLLSQDVCLSDVHAGFRVIQIELAFHIGVGGLGLEIGGVIEVEHAAPLADLSVPAALAAHLVLVGCLGVLALTLAPEDSVSTC